MAKILEQQIVIFYQEFSNIICLIYGTNQLHHVPTSLVKVWTKFVLKI